MSCWLKQESDYIQHFNPYHNPKNGQFAPKTTFVSGSSKTQDKSSPYYQRKLSRDLRRELNSKMKAGNKIIVGDAPGIDRQVQDYLKKKKYKNVEVYSPGKESRYIADKSWKNHLIDDPKHKPMSPEWLAKKDKVMAKVADEGIAVVLDQGSGATRNNIKRLKDKGKNVSVYTINPKTKDERYDKAKKIAKAGAIIVGAAAATYGGYKLHQLTKIHKQSKSLYKKVIDAKATAWAKSDMDDAARLGISKNFDSIRNNYLKQEIKRSAKDIRKLTMDEFKYRTKFNRRTLMDKIKPDMFGPRTAFMRSPMDEFKKFRGL